MSDAKLWFWGGTALLPGGKLLEDAAIGISDGKIVSVGTRAEAKPLPGARKIDSTGCLISPGLVNGHTHSAMTLLRGAGDDLPLERWLRECIFPAEKKWVSPEFVYWGSMLACAEMIRGGTTSFNDMYYFQSETARASNEVGLRHVGGQGLTEESDADGTAKDMEGTFERFQEAVCDFPLFTPALAPHTIYSVSAETWKKLVAYAGKRGIRINLHLQEDKAEEDFARKNFGKSSTEFFEEIGLWELGVCAAHAVCVSSRDIEILGRYKVGLSHNPQSNMKVGTQVAPVKELRRAGCSVAIGTDGAASNNNLDLLEEADFAAKLQSFKYGPGEVGSLDVFRMLTEEGAQAIGLKNVGRLESGQAADLIAVEVTAPHAVPLYNPYSHLVYSASGRDVRHAVVAGQVLMENRNLMTLDEQEILREAVSWARRIMA